MADDFEGFDDVRARAVDDGVPEYAQSDHAVIIAYVDTDGREHYVEDDDWRPPREEDLVFGDAYLLRLDAENPEAPANMPIIVRWVGAIDGVTIGDIYDYYTSHYEELSE